MKIFLSVIILVLTFTSCSSLKVTSDVSSDADFTKYKTFKVLHFVNEEDAEKKEYKMNELNRRRVEKAIANEAVLRNLEQNDKPDALFLYAVDIDMKKSYSTHTNYNGGHHMGYRGRHYGGYGMSSSQTHVQETEHIMGRLRIAMIDAETEELLWMSSASDEIKGNTKKTEQNINKVLARMMMQFPIQKNE